MKFDILLIKMQPERIWQSERKMSVGGSESLSEIKEKCIVSLHGELAGWRAEKKVYFLFSHFQNGNCVCVYLCIRVYVYKQLEMS